MKYALGVDVDVDEGEGEDEADLVVTYPALGPEDETIVDMKAL